MKIPLITSALLFACTLSYGQQKPAIGAWIEGGYYFPKSDLDDIYDGASDSNGQSWGTGIYGSLPVYKNFSASLGFGYRYAINKRKIYERNESGGGGYGYGRPAFNSSSATEMSYPKHYLILPLKLRYTSKPGIFLESGMEAAWLLNYDQLDKSTEFSWLLGVGKEFDNYALSVQYTGGLTDQLVSNDGILGPITQSQGYTNRSISLQFTHNLWPKMGKKKAD